MKAFAFEIRSRMTSPEVGVWAETKDMKKKKTKNAEV
jgi:hypothetical protein